jgi:hypothetical protein
MTPPRNEPVRELPSPRSSWAGEHKGVIVLLSAVLLVLAIGIVVTTAIWPARSPAGQAVAPAGDAAGGPAGSAGGTGGAAGGTGGGAGATPATAVVTSGDKWLTGPAGQLLRAVSADLGRLSTAERAGKPGAARIAGTHLAADAKTALTGPIPPVDAQIYRSALKDFKTASMYAMSGKFRKANILLNAGDSDIAKVTSALNPPVAVKEPIGQ